MKRAVLATASICTILTSVITSSPGTAAALKRSDYSINGCRLDAVRDRTIDLTSGSATVAFEGLGPHTLEGIRFGVVETFFDDVKQPSLGFWYFNPGLTQSYSRSYWSQFAARSIQFRFYALSLDPVSQDFQKKGQVLCSLTLQL